MKTLWRAWCIVCLGAMAGCSSSSADHAEVDPPSHSVIEPEWARTAPPAQTAVAAAKIQPIPDLTEEAPSSAEDPPAVRPFPDDAE